MASSSFRFLLFPLSLVLILSAIGGSDARPGIYFHPCKTLFISYSISSFKSGLDVSQNPNFVEQNPSGFVVVFSEINEFDPKPFLDSEIFLDRRPYFRTRPISFRTFGSDDVPEVRRRRVPFGSFGVSSLRERTKDILSVVFALLFGVGCGALVSATMYLAWSLITNRYDNCDYEEDDEGGDYEDIGADKMGYVKIPAAPAASPAVALTKEVV